MIDPGDVELQRATTEPQRARRRRQLWAAVPIGAVLLAAGLYFLAQQWTSPQPSAPVSEASPGGDEPPQAAAPGLSPEPADNIIVPPLDATDALVRELVRRLSSHPQVAAWLATDGLIRNFVVVTHNIADGERPTPHLRRLEPKGRFAVRSGAEALVIDEASYRRYDPLADAVAGLDARGAARLYATLKPRIDEASRELGNTSGDFTPILARAMSELLAVPAIDDDIALRLREQSYEYDAPELEGLTAPQRHLLRMGPRNIRLIQSKLREIAMHAGIRTN